MQKGGALLMHLHVNAINSGISLSDDQGSSATAAKDDWLDLVIFF